MYPLAVSKDQRFERMSEMLVDYSPEYATFGDLFFTYVIRYKSHGCHKSLPQINRERSEHSQVYYLDNVQTIRVSYMSCVFTHATER